MNYCCRRGEQILGMSEGRGRSTEERLKYVYLEVPVREARYPRVELIGKRHDHRKPLQPPIELVHHVQVLYLLRAGGRDGDSSNKKGNTLTEKCSKVLTLKVLTNILTPLIRLLTPSTAYNGSNLSTERGVFDHDDSRTQIEVQMEDQEMLSPLMARVGKGGWSYLFSLLAQVCPPNQTRVARSASQTAAFGRW